jgi:hypothetical protein
MPLRLLAAAPLFSRQAAPRSVLLPPLQSGQSDGPRLLIVRHWRKIASARLKSSDRNDRHVRIGRLLWQVNLKPAFCLSKFQGLPSCKQARRHNLHVQPGYLQRGRRPVKDVEEEFPVFCGGSNRFHVLHWSVRRPVYGFAVNREPIADSPETLLKFRLDQTVGLRSDVQQEVAATAGDFDEAPNEKLRRFIFTIIRVICPRLVYGHAGLPQLKIFWQWDYFLPFLLNAGVSRRKTHALCRDRSRDELLRSLIVSRHAKLIVHQSGRLQFPDQLLVIVEQVGNISRLR